MSQLDVESKKLLGMYPLLTFQIYDLKIYKKINRNSLVNSRNLTSMINK